MCLSKWGVLGGVIWMVGMLAGDTLAGNLQGVIYAETSGLRPVAGDVEGGGEEGHDPQSLSQLQQARRWIGEVALFRGYQGVAPPAKLNKRDRANNEAMAIWKMCREAASTAAKPGGSKVGGKTVTHFLLRKGGTPEEGGKPRRPNWAKGKTPVMSFGPFRCVGGGDVPAGENVWIDFFTDIRM